MIVWGSFECSWIWKLGRSFETPEARKRQDPIDRDKQYMD